MVIIAMVCGRQHNNRDNKTVGTIVTAIVAVFLTTTRITPLAVGITAVEILVVILLGKPMVNTTDASRVVTVMMLKWGKSKRKYSERRQSEWEKPQ